MSINAEGRHGEELALNWLYEHGCRAFQADWIAHHPALGYFVVEAKYQERFEAPPFDGHGLPVSQVIDRLRFMATTHLPTFFLVFDKATSDVFCEWLHVLMAQEEWHITSRQKRIVFPLSSFRTDADLPATTY